MVRKAIELSPYPPAWIDMAFFFDHFQRGRYEEALDVAKKIDMAGDYRGPLFVAAAYGELGRPDEAVQALDELRVLFRAPLGEIRADLIERHALTPGLTDHLLEGLRKAGLEDLPFERE